MRSLNGLFSGHSSNGGVRGHKVMSTHPNHCSEPEKRGTLLLGNDLRFVKFTIAEVLRVMKGRGSGDEYTKGNRSREKRRKERKRNSYSILRCRRDHMKGRKEHGKIRYKIWK